MGISGRISGYFLRHSITPLLALVALLMGVFATLITPREEEPQIEVTMANVMVPFPGASARDVEALIAKPGEQVLSRMAGVEHVFSVSRPGMAVMTVQFKVGVPEQTALVRLYDTVHSHQDWLSPELGVGAPVVKPKGIDDVPIVALTLWSKAEGASSFDLQQVARAAESEFKRIDGLRIDFGVLIQEKKTSADLDDSGIDLGNINGRLWVLAGDLLRHTKGTRTDEKSAGDFQAVVELRNAPKVLVIEDQCAGIRWHSGAFFRIQEVCCCIWIDAAFLG